MRLLQVSLRKDHVSPHHGKILVAQERLQFQHGAAAAQEVDREGMTQRVRRAPHSADARRLPQGADDAPDAAALETVAAVKSTMTDEERLV